jgi:hypothetical protein
MKIEATIPFTVRDGESGELISIAKGQVVSCSDEVGAQFISDGLAKEFTLITPTGNINITDTAETDVTAYATAQIVDENLVASNIKKGVTVLGIEGTYEA